MTAYLESAAVLLFNEDYTKIIIGNRKDIFYRGLPAIPGGRKKLWEKLTETAKREVRKEVGITIGDPLYGIGEITFNRDEIPVIQTVFACIYNGLLPISESDELRDIRRIFVEELKVLSKEYDSDYLMRLYYIASNYVTSQNTLR